MTSSPALNSAVPCSKSCKLQIPGSVLQQSEYVQPTVFKVSFVFTQMGHGCRRKHKAQLDVWVIAVAQIISQLPDLVLKSQSTENVQNIEMHDASCVDSNIL